jgi:hypothetical protein
LVPSDVIRFATFDELIAFEQLIAAFVDPGHNKYLWSARPSLRGFLLSPKFLGTATNLHLTMIADPYERLLDAHERGWAGERRSGMMIGRKRALSTTLKPLLIPRYRGFTFTAQARSIARGSLGQITAELWYFPLTPRVVQGKKGNTLIRQCDQRGEALGRAVTKSLSHVGSFL